MFSANMVYKDNFDVGAIIHYALVSHYRPKQGVINYSPYITMNLLNTMRQIFSLFFVKVEQFFYGRGSTLTRDTL